MDLKRGLKGEIPQGAVLVSRTEAFSSKYDIIFSHNPLRDVFLLKYGGAILGSVSALTGVVMLKHFRHSLGFRKEAFLSSAAACSLVPAVGSHLYHVLFVLPSIVLQDYDCSLCVELKSASLQLLSGLVVPNALALLSTCLTGSKLGSYIPPLYQPIAITKLGVMLAKQGNGMTKLAGLFLMNFFGGLLIVHGEELQLHQFHQRKRARSLMTQE